MAEGLQTPDGKPVEVGEQDFARAMAAPEPDEPVASAPPRKTPADPDAPYGRTKTGEPKRGPGGRPSRTRHDAPRAAKAAPGPAGESPQEARKRRTDGIKGLVQMASAGTLVMYQRNGSDAFLADTLTLTESADPIADAVAETASVSPEFAKLVDKVTNVGPYAALVTVTVSVAAQLMANHGIAVGRMLGAKDPQEIVSAFKAGAGLATADSSAS